MQAGRRVVGANLVFAPDSLQPAPLEGNQGEHKVRPYMTAALLVAGKTSALQEG
jgi:hypothetical protein